MAPAISVVVVAHDMARELPRTLLTLSTPYQREVSSGSVEVIVVDNGSSAPVDEGSFEHLEISPRVVRIDDASPSPAHAANVGIGLATSELVGLVVDGARMASPGLLATARRARGAFKHPVVATVGYHLGSQRHMDAGQTQYDQVAEDELLASVPWVEDGYRLLSVSTLAGSSAWGWFQPLAESSALFMTRGMWNDLGGLDERFALPGGGLVNHDLYRRACSMTGTKLVVLLGEGTFHQYHGGAATSRRLSFEDMQADYVRIRGERYRAPNKEAFYFGKIPTPALGHVAESAGMAMERRSRRPGSSPQSQ